MSRARCPRCGALNPGGALFCTRCGEPLKARLCPSCGARAPVGSTHCPYCGAPLVGGSLAAYRRTMRSAQPYIQEGLRPREGIIGNILLVAAAAFRDRPPLFTPSPAVYEKLSSHVVAQASRYLWYALAAFLAGSALAVLGLAVNNALTLALPAFLAAIAPALLYLLWLREADRYEPEPAWLLALVFSWGAASTIPSLPLGAIAALLTGGWAGSAALVEEPLKILGVYLISISPRLRSEVNDHLDGLLYGAAAGLGFGFVENVLYIGRGLAAGSPFIIVVRTLAIGMHMFCSGLIGWWIGYLKVNGLPVSWSRIAPAMLVSMGIHAAWNTLAQLSPVTALLVLPLGPYLVYRTHKMAEAALVDEYYWGFAHGYAPVERPAEV